MDLDGDGVTADAELAAGAGPFRSDTDGDDLDDGDEIANGTEDGDGYTNAEDPNPFEGILFRHTDHLGSGVVLTRADQALVARVDYRAYGEATNASNNTDHVAERSGAICVSSSATRA